MKKTAKSSDPNKRAFQVVQEATTDADPENQAVPPAKGKDPLAVELGRRGGKKGGKARAEKLTPERRAEIARDAAAARWKKKDD